MISAQQAISILLKSKNKPYEDVMAIVETPDLYIISVYDGGEAYDTVNKKSGKIDIMWIWEYADEVDANRVTKLDLNSILKEAL